MPILTKYDIQEILHHLDGVRRCFDAIERDGGSALAELGRVYALKASNALLGVALTDIEIERPFVVRKIAITVPATQTERVS